MPWAKWILFEIALHPPTPHPPKSHSTKFIAIVIAARFSCPAKCLSEGRKGLNQKTTTHILSDSVADFVLEQTVNTSSMSHSLLAAQ